KIDARAMHEARLTTRPKNVAAKAERAQLDAWQQLSRLFRVNQGYEIVVSVVHDERGHPNIVPPAILRAREEDAARIVDLSEGVPRVLTQDGGNGGCESRIASSLLKARTRKSADYVL